MKEAWNIVGAPPEPRITGPLQRVIGWFQRERHAWQQLRRARRFGKTPSDFDPPPVRNRE